jgi:hypothetical protein
MGDDGAGMAAGGCGNGALERQRRRGGQGSVLEGQCQRRTQQGPLPGPLVPPLVKLCLKSSVVTREETGWRAGTGSGKLTRAMLCWSPGAAAGLLSDLQKEADGRCITLVPARLKVLIKRQLACAADSAPALIESCPTAPPPPICLKMHHGIHYSLIKRQQKERDMHAASGRNPQLSPTRNFGYLPGTGQHAAEQLCEALRQLYVGAAGRPARRSQSPRSGRREGRSPLAHLARAAARRPKVLDMVRAQWGVVFSLRV